MRMTATNRLGLRARYCVCLLIGGLSPANAMAAPEYIHDVTSEVYQTSGTAKEIASRAEICISQNLAPGVVSAPLIISKDLDQGVIVARSASEYTGGLVRWKIRSTFTFEARDGRFRIQQTNLERFNDQFNVGWAPLGKWAGSQWKGAETTFTATATVVAQCVMTGPKRENW